MPTKITSDRPSGALDQQETNSPGSSRSLGDFCPVSRSHVYAPAADLTPDTKSGRITSLPAQALELLRRRHEVLREFTTLLKEGLSATEIADYLGHENPFMTQDVHMNAIKGSKRAAEVMGQRPDGLI